MMIVFAPRSAGFAERFGRNKVMAAGLPPSPSGCFGLSPS